mgnify:CR=1 FL=1
MLLQKAEIHCSRLQSQFPLLKICAGRKAKIKTREQGELALIPLLVLLLKVEQAREAHIRSPEDGKIEDIRKMKSRSAFPIHVLY